MSFGVATYGPGGAIELTPNGRTMRYFYSFRTTVEDGSRAIPGWIAGASGYLIVEGAREIAVNGASVWENSGRIYWRNIRYLRVTCFHFR